MTLLGSAAPQPIQPAQHATPDGPDKGWSAADVHPDEYTGDDYADQFPTVTGTDQ